MSRSIKASSFKAAIMSEFTCTDTCDVADQRRKPRATQLNAADNADVGCPEPAWVLHRLKSTRKRIANRRARSNVLPAIVPTSDGVLFVVMSWFFATRKRV
jgi:hypothetical protein